MSSTPRAAPRDIGPFLATSAAYLGLDPGPGRLVRRLPGGRVDPRRQAAVVARMRNCLA